jgi:hypothetical protein
MDRAPGAAQSRGMNLDITKIKEAQARQDARALSVATSSPASVVVLDAQAGDDCVILLRSVPALLKEIERLKVENERRTIDIKRMRDLATLAREQLDSDMTATAYATLGAM